MVLLLFVGRRLLVRFVQQVVRQRLGLGLRFHNRLRLWIFIIAVEYWWNAVLFGEQRSDDFLFVFLVIHGCQLVRLREVWFGRLLILLIRRRFAVGIWLQVPVWFWLRCWWRRWLRCWWGCRVLWWLFEYFEVKIFFVNFRWFFRLDLGRRWRRVLKNHARVPQ